MVQTIGSAVYKARTLYALLNPMIQYNDRLMCIQGQNKNGGGYVNLDSLYEEQTNEEANNLVQQQGVNANNITIEFKKTNFDEFEDILIYPNPASTFIQISNYHDTGTFELYNSVGQRVLNQPLNEVYIQKVFLPKLSNGSYSYKIVDKNKTHFGKLNILQNE